MGDPMRNHYAITIFLLAHKWDKVFKNGQVKSVEESF